MSSASGLLALISLISTSLYQTISSRMFLGLLSSSWGTLKSTGPQGWVSEPRGGRRRIVTSYLVCNSVMMGLGGLGEVSSIQKETGMSEKEQGEGEEGGWAHLRGLYAIATSHSKVKHPHLCCAAHGNYNTV